MKICSIEGCTRPLYNKEHGWCRAHYSRWSRHGSPTAGYRSRGVKLAFLKKAIKRQTDDCIVWPFCTPTQRYGFVKYNKRQRLVHRVVCRTVHGKAPTPEYEVGHTCKNTRCINHRHIRWVTHSQNNFEDKIDQETIMRGARHHKHKLTEDDVYKIRRSYDYGSVSCTLLAYVYDVTPTQIVRIGKRTAWYWLVEKAKL